MRSAVAGHYLLFPFLLLHNVASLNMTVQVTLNPSSTNHFCSIAFFDLLEPLLTLWVTLATMPIVPDFTFEGVLALTYHNPSRRRGRMLRADGAGKGANTRSLTTSPTSCTTCTSSGCSRYCGNGACNLCATSRRLTAETVKEKTDTMIEETNQVRDLAMVDFAALGINVSATVRSSAQSFLLSHVFDIIGCLGDPSLLMINVTFLENQIFSI